MPYAGKFFCASGPYLAGITGARVSSVLLKADTGDTLSLGNWEPHCPEADHSGKAWGGGVVVTTMVVDLLLCDYNGSQSIAV